MAAGIHGSFLSPGFRRAFALNSRAESPALGRMLRNRWLLVAGFCEQFRDAQCFESLSRESNHVDSSDQIPGFEDCLRTFRAMSVPVPTETPTLTRAKAGSWLTPSPSRMFFGSACSFRYHQCHSSRWWL